MQKDFHYYVVKILAVKAGFDETEAQVIAHASQYVDDATTHKPARVNNPPDFIHNHPRYDENMREFDPICTAHKLFGYIEGIHEIVQKKVYVSFHFIPEKNFSGINYIKQKHYVTKENGELANELMKNAVNELKSASNLERTQKLIKLGLTIHSYADTWSHQGFSGIHSPFNDIQSLKFKKDGEWNFARYGYRPDIGHAEADHYPDITNLEWKYKYDGTTNITNAKIERKNSDVFMDASKHIFQYLCDANNNYSIEEIWNDFKDGLAYCLRKSTNDDAYLKRNIFNEKFPNIKLYYDENIWKNDAMNNQNYNWFYFHIEAYNQRQYIVNL
jgi:hypothetical protein